MNTKVDVVDDVENVVDVADVFEAVDDPTFFSVYFLTKYS